LKYYTARIAANWTDTSDYNHYETLLLELTAPQAYGNAPTKIQFHSLIGRVTPPSTAHSIAAQVAATIAQRMDSPQALASTVSDCSIGADRAAVFGYTNGTGVGYWLYVVHKNYPFEIRFSGLGGISDSAMRDALGMMGSITWGAWNVPGEA
jgi:hypothetical protein